MMHGKERRGLGVLVNDYESESNPGLCGQCEDLSMFGMLLLVRLLYYSNLYAVACSSTLLMYEKHNTEFVSFFNFEK